jgi:hypothetical protein
MATSTVDLFMGEANGIEMAIYKLIIAWKIFF